MMDCSNPVYDSSRMTIGQMMREVGLYKRQDLNYLSTLAQGAERLHLAEPEKRGCGGALAAAELKAVSEEVQCSVPATKKLDLTFLKEVHAQCPISRITFEGVPIHPAGMNQSGGHVSVSRNFGGSFRDKNLISRALEYYEPSQFSHLMAEKVYSGGLAAGFEKRLREQTSRKCVPITYCSGIEAISTKKRADKWGRMSQKAFDKRIAQLFPVNIECDLAEDLEVQFENLVTSKVSSAGAPYWKKKPDAVPEMVHGVMPLVVEALTSGKVKDLWAEQPELFLVECRNKVDRYEVAKLGDKCRPYFSYPFHLQVLFSMISQPFSKGLRLFHETKECANAYGFSWAHGGGDRILEFCSTIGELGSKTGRPRFYCYGDDVDLFYRKNGTLYRISPDFRQMDGSVDEETIRFAVRYMVNKTLEATKKARPEMSEEEFGEVSRFWNEVGELWSLMASDPDFVVEGKTVYKKPQADGLCTGVVGTTFFDTVKAAFAYDALATRIHDDRAHELLEEKHALGFFSTLGLEVKSGTWTPHVVLEQPSPGQLFSENKFLGVQLMWVEGAVRPGLVPYLSYEDWMRLIMVPRDDPSQSGKVLQSVTGRHRLVFDRARGYLITGGFSNPEIGRFCGAMINGVDPVAILMTVQADGGKGEKPEAGHVCGEDFSFPTSDGVPNELWCRNLYLGEDNQFSEEEAKWMPVFPGLVEKIVEWRSARRLLKPRKKQVVLLEVTEDGGNPDEGAPVVAAVVEDLDSMPPQVRGDISRGRSMGPTPDIKKFTIPAPGASTKQCLETADWQHFWWPVKDEFEDVLDESALGNWLAPKLPKNLKKGKVVKPKTVVKKTPRLETNPAGKPKEVKAKMPTLREVIEMSLATQKVASSVKEAGFGPYTVLKEVGAQGSEPEFLQLLNRKESWGTEKWEQHLYATPVVPLDVLANRMGSSRERIRQECRKLGYYVLGPDPSSMWVFKTPPVLDVGLHGSGVEPLVKEAKVQIAETKEASKVISEATPLALKALKRGERGWETAARFVSEEIPSFIVEPKWLPAPQRDWSKFPPNEKALVHANILMNTNSLKPLWHSRQVLQGRKQLVEVALSVQKVRITKDGVEELSPLAPWIVARGDSTRSTKITVCTKVVEFFERRLGDVEKYVPDKKPKRPSTAAKDRMRAAFAMDAPVRARVVGMAPGGAEWQTLAELKGAKWVPGAGYAMLKESGWVETGDGISPPVHVNETPRPMVRAKAETLTASAKRMSLRIRETVPKRKATWIGHVLGENTVPKCPEWVTDIVAKNGEERKAKRQRKEIGGKSVRGGVSKTSSKEE